MDQYLLQLMLTKGIGNAAIKKMMNGIGNDAGLSFESYCKDASLLKSVLYRPDTIDAVLAGSGENAYAAEKLSDDLNGKGIRLVTELDPIFPGRLKYGLGKDCPSVLFVKGNVELLSSRCVGFCGSRNVSEKGASITAQCSNMLVENGFTVVSGYANGTDIAAHREALRAKGNTIFVLAEGILESAEKGDIKELLTPENHLFVSQFLPNSQWSAANAMRRNSVIIGLSEAMILVESGRKGGTFAAGEESLKRRLPLYVIDYAKPEVSAEANPYFIEKGGRPIRSKGGKPNLDAIITSASASGAAAYVNEQISMFN